MTVGQLPEPDSFLTGHSGAPGGPLTRLAKRAADRALDARLALARRRLDALAGAPSRRQVLVLSVYRPGGGTLERALGELRRTRHDVRFALGSMGDAHPALAAETVATGMTGGKFENLNALLPASGTGDEAAAPADWVLVVDDDITLPPHFVDRMLGIAVHLDLALAQPAQSLASYAAWPVVRRRRGALARESRFVEIGPVTLFRRDAIEELTPFPPLRYGWGLDLHWAAVADERGLKLGIVDALPVRHEHTAVAASYSSKEAIAEAREFLAGHRFVDSRRAGETVRVHPLR